jgi:hypothetical protein
MQFNEYLTLDGEAKESLLSGLVVDNIDGRCSIDNYIVEPVSVTGCDFIPGGYYKIEDICGSELGMLMVLKGEIFLPSSADALSILAHIADCDFENFSISHRFSSSYLAIQSSRLSEYLVKFLPGAEIWGNFSHSPFSDGLTRDESIPIVAREDLRYPSALHLECAVRSVVQAGVFERFLKKYHMLELHFDKIIVDKIQALGPDLLGVGKILNMVKVSEFDRLKYQIESFAVSINDLERLLSLIYSDSDVFQIAKTILVDYRKETCPFPENSNAFVQIFSTGISMAEIESQKIYHGKGQIPYMQFLVKFAAYAIYRTRCCIAHNRIGEYILSTTDEIFVSRFAEPLLDNLLFALCV